MHEIHIVYFDLRFVSPDHRLPQFDLRNGLPHHLDALQVEIALLPFEAAAPRPEVFFFEAGHPSTFGQRRRF